MNCFAYKGIYLRFCDNSCPFKFKNISKVYCERWNLVQYLLYIVCIAKSKCL